MNERMNERTNERTNEWMNERTNKKRMNERTNERINKRKNERTNELIYLFRNDGRSLHDQKGRWVTVLLMIISTEKWTYYVTSYHSLQRDYVDVSFISDRVECFFRLYWNPTVPFLSSSTSLFILIKSGATI